MKTATVRDGQRVRVGDLVEFVWEPEYPVSGRVTNIFRARSEDGWNPKTGVVLSVVGADGYAEVPARHVWKASE